MPRMPMKRVGFHLLAAVALLGGVAPSRATVVVIANRAPHPVRLDTILDDGAAKPLTLAPGDSRPLFANKSAQVRVGQGEDVQEIKLQPNAAYSGGVRPEDGSLGLGKFGWGKGALNLGNPATPGFEWPEGGVITVKLWGDDEESQNRRAGEPPTRRRFDRAPP